MNKNELQKKLDILGVDSCQYSLDGGLNRDCLILYHSYHDWNVFYFDERGGRNNERTFHSESDACEYIFNLFIETSNIEKRVYE